MINNDYTPILKIEKILREKLNSNDKYADELQHDFVGTIEKIINKKNINTNEYIKFKKYYSLYKGKTYIELKEENFNFDDIINDLYNVLTL